jgi:hypothetical protein
VVIQTKHKNVIKVYCETSCVIQSHKGRSLAIFQNFFYTFFVLLFANF